jgi:hypothetical protein
MDGRGITILKDLFAANAIETALFSDFPTIVFVDASDEFGEGDWHASLGEFAVRYSGGSLRVVHHRAVKEFGEQLIPGPVTADAFLDPTSVPELARLLQRHRRSVLIFARNAGAMLNVLPAN